MLRIHVLTPSSSPRSQVKVCLIDSGLLSNHPDLTPNVLKGWNVLTNDTSMPGEPSPFNYNDTLGHGTHVAGLVGAVGNNGVGVSGVAWKTALLPCRFIGASGTGFVSDAITCMHLCRAEGAHVYSNSWGGMGYSETLLAEIEALEGLFVVAAGNNMGLDLDVGPLYPAAFNASNIITVAATARTGALADFSNFGRRTVHLAAPGDALVSTSYTGGYGLMSGTSMATPLVAGAAALLQSLALTAGSALPPGVVRQLLEDSVDPMDGGAAMLVSGGKLNVARAVQRLQAQLGVLATQAPQGAPLPSSVPQQQVLEVAQRHVVRPTSRQPRRSGQQKQRRRGATKKALFRKLGAR
jgi:subtilisin family serine protease